MAIKKFPVEASHILMFARAINDPNPIYSDEEVARRSELGAIPAPPARKGPGRITPHSIRNVDDGILPPRPVP